MIEKISKKDGRCCLNANLRKTCRTLNNLYANSMRNSELKGTQYSLLAYIHGFSEITISELAERMLMDQTTVTRSIKLLSKAGLVSIVPGTDRRQRIIQLTEQGHRALNETRPMWLDAQERVWERLGEEKIANLFEIMNEINALD